MRLLLCVSTVAGLLLAQPSASTQARRVVAVGDIHGAFAAFTEVMRAAGLIDAAGHWAGGSATFVQTGDVTDRGADVRRVLDLLIALASEANQAGGRVLSLLGNHEVMNLLGEQRDVTADIYATFADGESESRRTKAWEEYAALAETRRKRRPDEPLAVPYAQARDQWLAAHPPGWLEYREAFGPRGKYGAWLRERPIAATVDGTLFMHAGVDPTGDELSVATADKRAKAEIAAFDSVVERLVRADLALPFFTLTELTQVAVAEITAANAVMAEAKTAGRAPDLRGIDVDLLRGVAELVEVGESPLFAENGPLWYRGYAAAPEASLRDPLKRFFARNDITRIVVGHSPLRERRIMTRLGGAVVLIDTGMLASAYQGRPSALEIADGRMTAIYTDTRVPLDAPKPSGDAALALQEQRQ